jgi:predicted DNA-binding protein
VSKKALRSVYLDSEQVERLKNLSAITRVPQAVYIREGLDLVMDKYENKTKKGKAVVRGSKNVKPRSLKLLKR